MKYLLTIFTFTSALCFPIKFARADAFGCTNLGQCIDQKSEKVLYEVTIIGCAISEDSEGPTDEYSRNEKIEQEKCIAKGGVLSVLSSR